VAVAGIGLGVKETAIVGVGGMMIGVEEMLIVGEQAVSPARNVK
jgi:hypothetical protein